MTTVDTQEIGEDSPPHRAKIQWGIPEISAVLAILASLLAGASGIIKIAVAQDRTERMAVEAKLVAEKAASEVSGVKERLTRIEEQVKRIPDIDLKLDRLLERSR